MVGSYSTASAPMCGEFFHWERSARGIDTIEALMVVASAEECGSTPLSPRHDRPRPVGRSDDRCDRVSTSALCLCSECRLLVLASIRIAVGTIGGETRGPLPRLTRRRVCAQLPSAEGLMDPEVDDQAAQPHTTDDAQGHSPARKLRSWIVRLRWPALAIGLVMAGAGVTYLVAPPVVVSNEAIVVNPADLDAALQRTTLPMPSLLGLNRDVAQTVLLDSGLDGVAVKVVERPSAGPAAQVVEQQPPAGTATVDNIELVVSVPVPMPAVIGSNLADARPQLEQLGAVVEIVTRFDPAVPKNQVLDSNPKPGESVPALASLTVADPGDALTLASVRSVDDSNCDTVSSVTVNGNAVGDSVTCDSGSKPAFVEYSVSRQAAAFEAVVGTDDRGRTGAARVVVFGDGRELAAADVWLGHSVPLRADLNGIMRMHVEVTTADRKQHPTVVLGDGRLLGLPQGLDAIADQ